MQTTQEKIGQYIGIKYGEDIANELTNKATVTIPPPVYSTAILLRHQEWERHVRRKQVNMRTALDAKFNPHQESKMLLPLPKLRTKWTTSRIIRASRRCPTTSQTQRSSSTGTRARRTVNASLLWRNIVAMCMHLFTDSAHKSCRTK